jgi:PAS domain S-box-containing protein
MSPLRRDSGPRMPIQDWQLLTVALALAGAFLAGVLLWRRHATVELRALNAQLAQALEEKSQALQAQADFRVSFESAAVGQVHSDADGRIIRANRAYAQMLGYEPEELVGRIGWDFTLPDELDDAQARHAGLLAGSLEPYSREKRYRRRDGTVVWGRVSGSVVRAPDTGEPALTVAIVEDIDARYKAQASLQQAKHDLELVVEQRTAALAQRDLLLREVYHRVKNNLQIVDSLLLMQSRRLADPDAKGALENLRDRVYALGLVHHQLMGSADLETFDIAPFLLELSKHLLEGVGANGITLSVRAAPLRVGLDFAIPLGLLVTELVTNSMKHAFAGGRGAITVELDEAGEGELVLQVSDNGEGYVPAEQGAPGRSLGATIIEGLVQQLKGVLTISMDGGSRSVVRLPAPAAS